MTVDVDKTALEVKDTHIANLMQFIDRQRKMFNQFEETQRTKSE